MKVLVGNTGFVGSNLCDSVQFDAAYHSTDIAEAYGIKPDLLIYAGVRAEKYMANTQPEQDMECIRQAAHNIEQIAPKKLVLISTVDVFPDSTGKDEHAEPDVTASQAYGRNRAILEQLVRKNNPDALIVRLPALFGNHLKKNFLYDMIHVIPSKLKEAKLQELSLRDAEIGRYYTPCGNGFCELHVSDDYREELKQRFRTLGFTALHFTDSRSQFQFYPLDRLWRDIQTALAQELTVWHPATEPVTAFEIYQFVMGEIFKNHITQTPPVYDYRTLYAELFGGHGGYIADKAQILQQIKEFCVHETTHSFA